MASGGKLEAALKNFLDSIRESTTHFLSAFPDQHESNEIPGGHGKAAGSTCFCTCHEGIPPVNEEKMEVSYRTVIERDLLKYYKKCKATIAVTPKGDESLVKWMCEYEKASEYVEVPRLAKYFVVKSFME